MSSEVLDRGLVLDAVRVTEIAAIAAWKLVGRGDEKAADQAAVDAMRTALNDLAATSRDGKWPTRTQIARAKRARQALDHTTDALTGLARDMDVRVLRVLPRLTGMTATWQARIIGAQMPNVDQTPDVRLGVDWDRVDPKALDAIVTRAAGQVQSRSYPLAPRAVAAMKSEIIRGIAVGDNPRVAAARMLARVEGHFNGGLTRALVIARTEMLDAHREASAN